ncbi:hypothetical protein ABPG74_000721 [Tetrahymena malaccensis]
MELNQQLNNHSIQQTQGQEDIYDVIVIGSGISGLATAHNLVKNNYKVKILEARSVYGGRISKNENLANFAVETGGEEIHLRKSAYFQLAQEMGADIISEIKHSVYFVEHPQKEEMITEDDFFEQFPQYDIWAMAEKEYDQLSFDVSIKDYLEEKKIYQECGKFYQNLLGTENGTLLSKISWKGVQEYDNLVEKSDHSMITNMSHYDVITKAFSDVLPLIQYDSPVNKIDYSDQKLIKVFIKDGSSFQAKQVLITVTISQLKNNSIEFIPTLPQNKLDAIKTINFGISGKLQYRFKERFWPENFNSIILWDHDFGMTWNSSLCKDKKKSNVLTTLLVEDVAVKVEDEQVRKQLIQTFLEKLAKLFKNEKIPELIEEHIYTGYSTKEYIEGGYTTPTLHWTKERKDLAEPIQNRLFFGGEATSILNHSTIHGAYESALVQTENILLSNKK